MSQILSSSIDLKSLRCFWSMAKYGNLAKAGVDVGVSEATACRYVETLEHRLATKLFEARGGEITLTQAGERTAQKTRELFDEARLAIAFYRHHQA